MRRRLLGVLSVLAVGTAFSVWAAEAPGTTNVTLEACIATALRENPGLRSAEQMRAAARTGVAQARAGYFPSLGIAANAARTDNPPQAFMMTLNQRSLSFDSDFNNPEAAENVRLSLLGRYLLWDGGQRGLDRRMARVSDRGAEAMVESRRNALIYDVIQAFYDVLKARAMLDVYQTRIDGINESLRVARERLAAGAVMSTDVLNLEVRGAEAEEALIVGRNALTLAVAVLNNVIGVEWIDEATPLSAVADVLDSASPSTGSEAGDRPELRAAERAAEGLRLAWRRERAGGWPRVNALGSLDYDSDDLSAFENSYVVGVGAELEFFDGLRRANAAREARARYEAALEELEQLRNHLRLDLKQARLGAQEARERLAVSRKGLASAEEALRVTRERYRQGEVDIAELLNAESALAQTRARCVAANYATLTAAANIRRAEGGLAADERMEE